MPKGLALRNRLVDVLATFRRVYMVTVTIDPLLFQDPPDYPGKPPAEAAYLYCRDKRCVARFVKGLHAAGFLNSDRYFYVVEWHKRTGFPHFHIILDAEFIPFAELCRAWNHFRPDWAGPPTGNRPGFGSVQFTKSKYNKTRDAEGCAWYAAKYLTKHPDNGYPDWVMDARYRIRRFSTSRGFGVTPHRPVMSQWRMPNQPMPRKL